MMANSTEINNNGRPNPKISGTCLTRFQQKKKIKQEAYELFFRDTQAAIRNQNPNATFDEVSKIVRSMWLALDSRYTKLYLERARNVGNENAVIQQKENKASFQPKENVLSQQNEKIDETSACSKLPVAETVQEQQVTDCSEKINESQQNMCIRQGCTNAAIQNSDWKDEFCSNTCVVRHCLQVFYTWVAERT